MLELNKILEKYAVGSVSKAELDRLMEEKFGALLKVCRLDVICHVMSRTYKKGAIWVLCEHW